MNKKYPNMKIYLPYCESMITNIKTIFLSIVNESM